jgi:hypothetical protein
LSAKKWPGLIYASTMDVHSLHLVVVFALVVLVFLAFLREWLSPDLVALTAMRLPLVTGILGTEETLAVFQQQRADCDRQHVRAERGAGKNRRDVLIPMFWPFVAKP